MIVEKTIMRYDRQEIQDNGMADYPKDMLHDIAQMCLRDKPHVSYDTFAAGLDGYLEPIAGNVEKTK